MPTLSAVRLLGQVQLGTSLTTIYTVPSLASAVTQISAIWIANTDSADHTVTLRMGTGTLTVANSLGEAWAITANKTTIISDENLIVLSEGMVLQGLADAASKITVTLFGREFL
jgi:hypothetical protein